MTPKAVGIQMKLEFFQRKFWTASRQVSTEICAHGNIYIYQTSSSKTDAYITALFDVFMNNNVQKRMLDKLM